MRTGHGGYSRRQKRFLYVAPLPRSQSLNAIPNQPLHSERRASGGNSSVINLAGSQHLPPLGGKDRRCDKHQRKQCSNGKNDSRHAVGRSLSWGPAMDPAQLPSEGSVVVPALGCTAFADVCVRAGQAAGIAFQWAEMDTTPETRVPAKPAGLIVVGVADGSLAAKHGGISAGMMLVEINRASVAGMSQEKMMRLMRQVASQPRVLTLARITGHPLPPPPTPQCADGLRACSAEARPEVTEINSAREKPCALPAASSAVINASRQANPDTGDIMSHSLQNSQPQALASSTTGANGRNAPSRGGSDSALLIPLHRSYSNRAFSTGSSVPRESSQNLFGHSRAPTSICPQRLIALRFVGSRGNTSLFDRDHVLGLKMRDIEFVPTNVHLGGESSPSSRLTEEHRRANSKRSLQDLTRDWRNDPFSTPARRRRLINDVCKVIVRSYTHASVSRVAELRREEFHIVRIQAGYRMRKARRLFCAKLAKRRVKAASVLQLGWLSCVARNRVGLLRKERVQYRRAQEDERARCEARERKERRRREEEQREAEGQEISKRRHVCMVIFVQRRIRAQREARRRLAQDATGRHADQQRKVAAALQATTSNKAAFRRLQDKRLWLQEEQAQQERARSTGDAAAIHLQTLWRRWAATKLVDRRRRERTEASTFALSAQERAAQTTYGSSTSFNKGAPCPSKSASGSPKRETRKFLRGESLEGTEEKASRGENWSSVFEINPSFAAEKVREETQVDAARIDNSRQWTATGATEQSIAMAPPGHPHAPGPPPAGMMTVTVRRGAEETNLVTPIVLTENGGEGDVRAEPPSSELVVLSPAQVSAAVSGNGFDGSKSVDRAPDVDRIAQSVVKNVEVRDAVPAARADGASEEKPRLRPKTGSPADAASVAMSLVTSTSPTLQDRESNTSAARKHLPLSYAAINEPANDHAIVPPPNEGGAGKATTTSVPRAPADDIGSQLTAAKATNEATAGADRTLVKPAEQLFMEDSQVYLGCAICGVRYLVEAIDPRMGKTVQAGQPAPEVLYLCTTCGGTLRNNGEDGRWRRRRRPSSAPPASRRRGGAFFFNGESSDSDAGKCNIVGGADAARWNGVTSAAAADGLVDPVEISRQLLRDEREDRPVGKACSITRLTYAHCARRIQHVYRDFRHRQYLRDWAFSLLRRWLACRVQSRRKVKCRLLRRRAAVTVQSAARAAFARTRCAALRAARFRLWMKRFAALYGDDGDDCSVSPMATVLLKDLATNPPSPSPPQTPPQLQPPALLPQCSACATARGSMSGAGKSTFRGRALAEALAPRMGSPPPGCPAALDIDWGEWGVGFSLVFPPSPRVV